jgi:DNA polymerase-3 subunit beta
MRFTARTDTLATVIAFARRGAEVKSKTVLNCVLLRVDGCGGVEITGHALNHCHTAVCAATVHETGGIAVPANRLGALLDAMPGNSEVTVASTDAAVMVQAGRSRYRLSALPAADFPAPLTPKAAASVTLTPADTAALLVAPSVAVSADSTTRLHLCGIHVQIVDGRLATVAMDGVKLLRRISAIEAKLPCGIIIPTSAATEIVRLARHNSVALATDGRVIEARAGTARFASKLIDGIFPDYVRLLPPPAATAAVFDGALMRGALTRLAAVSGRDDNAAVGFMWDGGGALSLVLANEDNTASDTVAATTSGTGCAACSVAALSGLIEAIGTKRVRLSIEDKPGAVLRLDAPDDSSVVAISSPKPAGG